MKRKTTILLILFLSLIVTTTAATAAPAAQEETEVDLLTVIQNDDRLTKLATLIDAVQLEDNLDDDGPFTIFAPTDAAITAFENRSQPAEANMSEIVLYHVVSGTFESGLLLTHDSLTTLMGDHVEINIENNTVLLDDTAEIIEADIPAANGVIHLIDTVMIPEIEGPADEDEGPGLLGQAQEIGQDDIITEEEIQSANPTLSQFLLLDGRFDVLYGLLQQADLLETLDERNDFTLLAPTDAAFAEVTTTRLERIMNDQSLLEAVLLYHVIGDSLTLSQIATDEFIPTLLPGRALFVEFEDGVATVNFANFTDGNIQLANGTVHVIDDVLNP